MSVDRLFVDVEVEDSLDVEAAAAASVWWSVQCRAVDADASHVHLNRLRRPTTICRLYTSPTHLSDTFTSNCHN